MQAWNHIINTVLLGTGKKELGDSELPAGLMDLHERIQQNSSLDKEEKFLQIVAAAFNYRQCGITPLHDENITAKEADKEEKPYCNFFALHVLTDIIEEQSHPLLDWWLQHCNTKNQVVAPDVIPALFDIAASRKKLRTLIINCCGKRGEWLSRFNPGWSFYTTESDESLWQNGTTEQRKKVLQQQREKEPVIAREWLQQTWQSESANTRAELLKEMQTNLSNDDLEWLQSLQEEKSQKVKEVVIELLKRLPSSSIVSTYSNIASNSITLKKEKSLLGFSGKSSLHIELTGVDEAIFKTGIEKLSNIKEFTDDEFILFQLLQFVPPKHWETQFALPPSGVIELFQKHSPAKKMLPALAKAVVQFTDTNWAHAFLQNEDGFYASLLSILTEEAQDKYSLLYFDKEPATIVQINRERNTEWSLELTKKIFRHTAKNIYQFNKNFYNEIIHLVPAPIIAQLEKCTPTEEYLRLSWSHMSEYIIRLITLKLQTIQAFQS